MQVFVEKEVVGELTKANTEFVYNYASSCHSTAFVSLTMPVRAKSYIGNQLHPIFEMHLPEGYLLSIIKKHFAKITQTDDFGLLQLLSTSLRGRVEYSAINSPHLNPLHLEDLLSPGSPELFEELVSRFALYSPLSGVQPKVIARIENKVTLQLDHYIVKAWGVDYPELALNEFCCMQAVKNAGINVPAFYLSDDEKLFIMKRFDILEKGEAIGFEDMCVLQAKQKEDKYTGSYEQLAKSLQIFTSSHLRFKSLEQFFKMIVMNTFLENGDAHLKNFGVLYQNKNTIQLAPAYDVVSTTAYIKNDIPALTLLGSKRWHGKDKLIQFGIDTCYISKKQGLALYEQCLQAMKTLNLYVTNRLKNELMADKINILLHLKKLSERVTQTEKQSGKLL